jgi:four helix bundle protein
MIKSYEDLLVWQKSYALSLEIYKITRKFPKTEIYGLTSQIRRSSVSIPTNIAEGRGRQHIKEFLHFLYIAKGSLEETKVYLRLAKDLEYISSEEFFTLTEKSNEVGRLLSGLIRSLHKGGGHASPSTQHLAPST